METVQRGKTVGIAINSGTGRIKGVPQLVGRLRESLAAFDAKFVVAYGPKPLDEPAPNSEGVTYLPNACRQGEGVIRGFDRLISTDMQSKRLIYIDSDHVEILLNKLPELAIRIGENIVIGRWQQDAMLHMPHSQYVAETGISYAISFASPFYPQDGMAPSWKDRKNFESRAKEAGELYSVYLGLAGMPDKAWMEVSKAIPRLFTSSIQDLKHAGIDAGLILVAQLNGYKADNSLELPKHYGHEHYPRGSEGEKKYSESRLSHFMMEARVMQEFLQKTNPKKLPGLRSFLEEMAEAIRGVGFHWPDRDVPKSGFGTGERSSFVEE